MNYGKKRPAWLAYDATIAHFQKSGVVNFNHES